MIQFMLNEALESRGKSAYWLARETGISESVLWRMRHGRTGGVQFDTLERICRALECQPGDLLVLTDDKRGEKRKAKGK